ncbi:class I SAM-dependent methyltransferase [Trichocoleus sp. FACHB-591]|uniref:class I SAM-dependent methyltransferase n=1 Tax=Trichocoleus sp. FACHB-591 TaxID=2692872 RepID=UPI00168783D7|nr:class I SAM-dependent methyltransferase [Trichocoleus sp. FACHB-591]MBD2097201.1 class I SAM-dependent methyltransferase [Trichocoleus sp. FACHB-591]
MQDLENSQPWPHQDWYRNDLTQRKSWYGGVAQAYDQARPRYPQALIRRVVELAQLPADANILELGCGPGIATRPFAQLGYSMVCLEPSQAACQLTQQHCAAYPNIEVHNTSFEEWPLEAQEFHAVLAATSFHWIDPEIRHVKSAAALRDRGALILLWNTPPQPSHEISQVLEAVYRIHAPSLAVYEDHAFHAQNLNQIAQLVIDSGQFQHLVSEQLISEVTYSIDNYLMLLSTLSPYIALEPQQRDALFTDLQAVLEETCDGSLLTSYLSAFHIARKV